MNGDVMTHEHFFRYNIDILCIDIISKISIFYAYKRKGKKRIVSIDRNHMFMVFT